MHFYKIFTARLSAQVKFHTCHLRGRVLFRFFVVFLGLFVFFFFCVFFFLFFFLLPRRALRVVFFFFLYDKYYQKNIKKDKIILIFFSLQTYGTKRFEMVFVNSTKTKKNLSLKMFFLNRNISR